MPISSKCFFTSGIFSSNKISKIKFRKYNKGNSSENKPLKEYLYFFLSLYVEEKFEINR